MNKKIFFIALLGFFVLSPLFVSAAAAKAYKNDLSQKDWAKYGVNPWRLDTDNDGYSDAWEVKRGYCPTNPEAIKVSNQACVRGKISFTSKTYTPPANLKGFLPREIRRFSSCTEMNKVLNSVSNRLIAPSFGVETGLGTADMKESVSALSAGEDFSPTNIQVVGVDEGDIVKTDGKYIYNLSGENFVITKATPASQMKVMSKTALDGLSNPQEIYIEDNYLLVVGTNSFYTSEWGIIDYSLMPRYYPHSYYTAAQVWDISDRAKPVLLRSVEYDGSYLTSRLAGGYVYLVLRSFPPYRILANNQISTAATDVVPLGRDRRGSALQNSKVDFKPVAGCANIDYVYPVHSVSYLQIVALPLRSPLGAIGEKIILGGGDQVYASTQNLYVAAPNYGWISPSARHESTEIYKFKFNQKNIDFVAAQTVPGTVLNQWSLDENNGNFRIFTTEGRWWGGGAGEKNNLYVFDGDLNRIGWYEDFGEAEKIYSARFIGERAYVVTFKKIDPLFVFDLKNPREPRLLGRLDVPGYSNYLHPYDATHLIGIGKNAAIATNTTGFAWYQGMKMAIFDVSDPAHPLEMFKTEIGDRGTDSAALSDHHAFLFSKQKKLLALPVHVAQFTPEQKAAGVSLGTYGTENFVGLYVWNIDLAHGFSFLGAVSHDKLEEAMNVGTGEIAPSNLGADIRRSLYIGDYLYALSAEQITAHRLDNLDTVKEVSSANVPVKKESLNSTETRARDGRRLSDLKQLQTALELFFTDNSYYPAGNNLVLGVTGSACLNSANGFTMAGCSNRYMSVPSDLGNGQYIYTVSASGKDYAVKVRLEGKVNGLSGEIIVSPEGIKNKIKSQ